MYNIQIKKLFTLLLIVKYLKIETLKYNFRVTKWVITSNWTEYNPSFSNKYPLIWKILCISIITITPILRKLRVYTYAVSLSFNNLERFTHEENID